MPLAVRIETGYRAGLIGRIAEMHGRYYVHATGFDKTFECIVADGLAEFFLRVERPANQVWAAMAGEEVLGSVAMDGEDLGAGVAHLRWFIVSEQLRGTGTGRKLLAEAVEFADAKEYRETHLWTFAGLDVARHLYEAFGFSLAEEQPGTQWGRERLEQKFVRKRFAR